MLVVDDSPLARAMIRQTLTSDPALEVVGSVASGEQAIRETERLKPDVITMDLMMPGMGGLEAVREIMTHTPTPILVLSSVESGSAEALQALKVGAAEVAEKPHMDTQTEWTTSAEALISQVKSLANSRANSGGLSSAPIRQRAKSDRPPASNGPLKVVLIGASTGGPGALATVLGGLPADITVPVVVAQHISQGFVDSLVRHLDTRCQIKVVVAQDREALRPGTAYFASGGCDISISGSRLALAEAGGKTSPSVDRLFESGVRLGDRVLGIILTGMGDDGAKGLASLREAGAQTLAESESSAVIYGMPRVALESGAAERDIPVEQVAGEILAWAGVPVG